MTYRLGLDFAQTQDRDDPLARFRAEFHLPKQTNGGDEIYFCGNLLGLQPQRTQAYVIEELAKWRRWGFGVISNPAIPGCRIMSF